MDYDYGELHEEKRRGSFDFPIELYYVDKSVPRYKMPFHWHLEYELIRVLKGRFTLSLDGQITELAEGDSAWVGDGVVHGGTPHDGCIYECVVFDLGTLLHEMPLCSKSAAEFLSSENGFSGMLKKGTYEAHLADEIFMALEAEQKGYEWIVIGLLLQLLGVLIRSGGEMPKIDRNKIVSLKKALTYVKMNFKKSVTLDELAAEAGMSPKYFCRAFSDFTGKTPIEYLNDYRIEKAAEKLNLTGDSITEIAFSCGFNDMSYFSKTFKKHKGVTPSAYRKQNSAQSSSEV